MFTLIVLALLNGVCIGLSRAINGRLALDRGAFHASLCNHIVGFLFLSLLLVATGSVNGVTFDQAPWGAYLGGVIGALFVALNSYVLPRLGTLRAALLIISGQMLAGVVIDRLRDSGDTISAQILGVGLILLGVYVARMEKSLLKLMLEPIQRRR
ncbi:MAG: DMT family transporter [Serratia liquefaciens]|jgi:bacterial/archaeal transporter family-2 protein|nr:DMT family transporter [Serratia liquefaciens]MCH4232738.1 DMT family transporter [Serratia liquefaciens]MCH4262721.1 DMT family transporter [Serratia liquefaciens]MCI1215956.1 DMT family transporter [Serratia liquefaciens]MCI1236915.1 DMT family transporter [Serratia liquefaciens]